MDTVVRFSPGLAPWLHEQLDAGRAPAGVVRLMEQQRMPAVAARAIVEAFVHARATGTPAPRDAVVLPMEAEAAIEETPYVRETPRLSAGRVIDADGMPVRVAARAQSPALAVLAGVLTAEECEELVARARPRLQPSTLVDPATGRDVVSTLRTSFGMFFRPQEDGFIARIDRRLAALMGVPLAHGEGLQVLHYPEGAGSEPHFDFLVPSNTANRRSIERSGQRTSTLVAYLNDVPEGGETVFPAVGWAVSPQRGHAVHFEYANRLGQVDHASLHASAPVVRGEKWVATKWVRSRPFAPGMLAPAAQSTAPVK